MKIVIVEDEITIQQGLAGLIPKLNADYEVAGVASDGIEGLEIIARTRPDLVIMDIRMPKMDGLTMLQELRNQEVLCRVVVLTAYNEFDYAKQAIRLGIENYLLKPLKIPELAETLEKIHADILAEQAQNGIRMNLLSLEQILRGLILAELKIDANLEQVLTDQYGLSPDENLAMCAIWLGSRFDEDRETVTGIVENYGAHAGDYRYVAIQSSRYRLILVILYHMDDPEKLYRRSMKTLTPAILERLNHAPVFTFMVCRGISALPDTFTCISEARKWNLCCPEGSVIRADQTKNRRTVPISYSLQIEEHLRQAVAERKHDTYRKVIEGFMNDCERGQHDPDEIREMCSRCCLAILTEAQTIGRVRPMISRQQIVGRVGNAVTWEEITAVFDEVYQSVVTENETGLALSPLIRRALSIIEERYSEGITLEELAHKLGVSQEYLSAQCKKETGMTFKETVRRYQIMRVKELLLHSDLKLNQIADMAGYTDPKYMSKVFKEEVGMLPTEFRNRNR